MTMFESNMDVQGELPLRGMSVSRDGKDNLALDRLPSTIDLSFLKIEDMNPIRHTARIVGLNDGGVGLQVQISAYLTERGGYDENIDPETGEREYHESWILKQYGAPPELDNLHMIDGITYFESYPPEEGMSRINIMIGADVVWKEPEYEGGRPAIRHTCLTEDEFNIILPRWLKAQIGIIVKREIRNFKERLEDGNDNRGTVLDDNI
jgi:hypothetical protein